MLIRYNDSNGSEILSVTHDQVPRAGDRVHIESIVYTVYSVAWHYAGHPSVAIELSH